MAMDISNHPSVKLKQLEDQRKELLRKLKTEKMLVVRRQYINALLQRDQQIDKLIKEQK